MGNITLNASCLRLDAEYYSSAASDAKLADHELETINIAKSEN